VSNHLRLEALGNYSQTHFTLYPEQSKLSTSSFSPLYPQNLEVNINFAGREKDNTALVLLA
jgi:hypothetical protein